MDSKHQTLQGVAFPLHRDAVDALKRYKDKVINYVQLVSPCSVTYGGGYLFNERLLMSREGPEPFRHKPLDLQHKVLIFPLIFRGSVSHDRWTKESLWH